MSIAAETLTDLAAEEIADRAGAVPWWRIRTDPPPGTAAEADIERIRNEEDRTCELIDGIPVEKAVSDASAFVAIEIGSFLREFVKPRRRRRNLGSNGYVRLFGTQLRAPDVSFVRPDQREGDGFSARDIQTSPRRWRWRSSARGTGCGKSSRNGTSSSPPERCCSGTFVRIGNRWRIPPVRWSIGCSDATISSTAGR